MKRLLKRWLGPVLPRWVIDRIKARFNSQLNQGPVKDLSLEPSGSNIRCMIDYQWSFLAPQECRNDLSFHTSTQEGRAELSGIAEIALRGGILFDIGAHAGLISALFCAARPTNRVYSFEPSPYSQKRLEKIREINQLEERMLIQPTAIGRDKARLEMRVDPGGGQVQIQHYEHTASQKRIEVDVESLPQAAERLGVIPDCIKLDIEGYEFEAIQGALPFLSKHQPVLLVELHHNYLEERGLSPRQVMTMLTDCGYVFSTYTGQPLSAHAIADSPLQCLRFFARAKGHSAVIAAT